MPSAKEKLVIYQQLKQKILAEITSGHLEEGGKLPSERELCDIHSVSRVTVRQAITELVAKGILETIPGKGTYVKRNASKNGRETGNIAFIRCIRTSESSSMTDDVFYPAILSGIEAIAASRGCHCLVQSINEDEPEKGRLGELVDKVDGIVCGELRHLEFLRRLQAAHCPVVLVSPSVVAKDVDVVEIDNVGGAYQGVNYLNGLGHRRIAFIGGSPKSRPSQEREAGYLQALEDAGIPEGYSKRLSYGWRVEDGYTAMMELLNSEPSPTAVFTASDLLAVGAYQAAQVLGVGIGEDVSILGFDDIQLAEQSRPPLSTMKVRKHEMGENAARLLFDWLDGTRDYPIRIVVPTVLKERESARPPNSPKHVSSPPRRR